MRTKGIRNRIRLRLYRMGVSLGGFPSSMGQCNNPVLMLPYLKNGTEGCILNEVLHILDAQFWM
jgi:hypothetical protein